MRQPELSVLIGKTLTSVTNDNKEIVFCCSDGSEYKLFHNPGRICLEYTLARFGATIDDIDGDFDDLVGSPIIMAEEVSNDTSDERYRDEDRVRWTFYKFATVKGYVTVRWFGTSEYYSSSVEFITTGNGRKARHMDSPRRFTVDYAIEAAAQCFLDDWAVGFLDKKLEPPYVNIRQRHWGPSVDRVGFEAVDGEQRFWGSSRFSLAREISMRSEPRLYRSF